MANFVRLFEKLGCCEGVASEVNNFVKVDMTHVLTTKRKMLYTKGTVGIEIRHFFTTSKHCGSKGQKISKAIFLRQKLSNFSYFFFIAEYKFRSTFFGIHFL